MAGAATEIRAATPTAAARAVRAGKPRLLDISISRILARTPPRRALRYVPSSTQEIGGWCRVGVWQLPEKSGQKCGGVRLTPPCAGIRDRGPGSVRARAHD